MTNLPGGLCGAKAPAADGAELSLALSRDNSLSIFLAGPDWKIQPQTYEIVMQLDELDPFTFTMHGEDASADRFSNNKESVAVYRYVPT